ncbi:MAG: SAM-dependent chlorinase/fluorinase [Candidatus Methanosuratincola sp.]|nr:SAM-dependent chlorinase/fluorinase [Candidatus Methanosuratincola sp.]
MTIVTLTTDFGGHYAGIMKGVLKRIAPQAEVIDLTHDVEAWDVRSAAFVLLSSYKYFPDGTVHVVVVDPGVGTSRRAIAIRTRRYFFVGPDNGVLYPASEEDGVEEAFEISNPEFMLKEVSSTFQGRDVFAPAAAMIASGRPISDSGKRIDRWEGLEFWRIVGSRSADCEVVYEDRFGNLTLSLRGCDVELNGDVELVAGGRRFVAAKVRTFSDLKGGLGLLVGSAGFYEIVANRGSARSLTGARVGSRVSLEW